MKKNIENIELEKFRDMARRLLAYRAFYDYLSAGSPEPEYFFEQWINRSVLDPDTDMKFWTWRYFMTKLIIYRKMHKI